MTIDGQAGGGGNPPITGSFVVFDEGVLLGSVLGANFVGGGVEAVISGSYAHIMHTGTAGGGGAALTVVTGTHYIRELLYEVTLASSTGTISFPAVPQDYDHLEIITHLRTDRAANSENCFIQFNEDTTDANYYSARHRAGTVHQSNEGDVPGIIIATSSTATANAFGWGKIFVFDYMVTGTFTAVRGWGGFRSAPAESIVSDQYASWEKLEAVTSVQLQTALDNDFEAGSRIQVFGLKEQVVVTSVEGTTEPSIADLTVSTGTHYVEEVLYEVTLGGATGSIVIPGISQDYDHLRLIIIGRGDQAAAQVLDVEYNGDTTAANYFYGAHIGSVAAHTVLEGDSQDQGVIVGTDAGSDVFAHNEISILGYTQSKHKVSHGLITARLVAGDQRAYQWTQSWENTAAINRIDITPAAGNFNTDSFIQLIGIKETVLVTDVSGGVLVDGVTDFLALDDTPASYSGQSGSYARVDGDEDALEFVTPTFLNLDDTPASYNISGAFARVNAAQDGLEWIDPEPYIEVLGGVGFQNSWVNFGPTQLTAAYYRDPFNRVHLKGTIKDGTVGQIAFTLPAGYRPSDRAGFATVSNSALGYVYIDPDGTVNVSIGNNAWVYLDGISFRAEL